MYKKTRLVRLHGKAGRFTFGMDGETEVVSAPGCLVHPYLEKIFTKWILIAGEEVGDVASLVVQEKLNLNSNDEDVRHTRAVQCAGRKNHGESYDQGLPTVAVVGYTNVGKSTLVSAISNSDLYSDSQLFAIVVVDPKLRSVLTSGKKVFMSDTVRFISDLPVQLVEAFHATLEEVVEANLLMIEYEDDNVDFDECLVGSEDGEASNFSGEEGMKCELFGAKNVPSQENLEVMEDQEGDYSNGWFGSCTALKTTDDQQSEYPKDSGAEKQWHSPSSSWVVRVVGAYR
ncbi:GTP-binding protein [Pyrus ussuriensis x Pyrus communis]|uniref:GTP-binding protein n=1 Tax=Pyrus ussuriensis x Pyrus communis TaxID=2448454 RepID=A0A5N5GVH6_9ROSA|nr:GTP-binding protein [Pyrus ussuriensis x Pyrus communis]